MIQVLIADDQAMIRTALGALVDLQPDLTTVALAADCHEAVELSREHQPDVALLDVQMPSGGLPAVDGIEAIPELLLASPESRIIVLTTFGRPGYLQRAMAAGASGFLVKDASADRLAEAIRRVNTGLRVVDPELATASLVLGANPLSEQERSVLAAAAHGAASSEIAKLVHLSEGTVRNYLSRAIGKIGARNRTEAIRIATENGWLLSPRNDTPQK